VKNYKRLLSFLLALALVLGMSPVLNASASETEVTPPPAVEEPQPETAPEVIPEGELQDLPEMEGEAEGESEGESAPEAEPDTVPESLPEDEVTEFEEEEILASLQDSAHVLSCVIDPTNTGKVSISFTMADGVITDTLYLYALPTYVDSIAGLMPIASQAYSGGNTYSFTVDLNANTPSSLLYSKFCIAANAGGTPTAITGGNFITNPEVLATSNAGRVHTSSKKGVHIDFFVPTNMEDVGIEHTYFGIFYQDLLSLTPTDCAFTYNGRTYYIVKERITEYDSLISNMTRAGMSVSVGLQNRYQAGFEHMVHPGITPNGVSEIFALNTSTQEGLETAAAIHYFLANRYNGTDAAHGRVENWIFGNEVNDGLHYYYMGPQDVTTFVAEYLQSFRVAYTAIKSAYSNANVYMCLQHRWNTANSTDDYGGKSFIDLFNQYAKAQGDFDWGLAYHAYSFPLNDADILNDGFATVDHNGGPTFGGEVTGSLDTPIITMKNLDLLTNYFHSPELLNPKGEVRSIILSEQGYTSYSNITGQNEARQAANIVLAYYIAQMNKDIDAFILRGFTDAEEGSPYYKFGLRNQISAMQPGSEKFSYRIYKQLNTKNSLLWSNFAKAALNIGDWSEVVPGWKESTFSTMGSWTEDTLHSVTASTAATPITAGMIGQWENGYNVFGLATVDYGGVNHPDGFIVANPFANYLDWQGIEKHFGGLNLAGCDYLTMDVKLAAKDSSGASDRLEFKVRLRSGDHTYDSIGVISANKQYTLCVDLTKWEHRGAIDTIEIQIREYGAKKSFDGLIYVYNVQGASSVTDMAELDSVLDEKTDLSGAQLTYQTSHNHTGGYVTPEVAVHLGGNKLKQHEDYDVIYHNNVKAGTAKLVVVGIGDYSGFKTGTFTIQGDYPTVYNGVDYAMVYSYSYYLEHNPQVAQEVGTDPQAVLEHFVTKGMHYALQGIDTFNVLAYAKFNDDLREAFGNDWARYYMFHLEYGWKEGRATSGEKPADMEQPPYPGAGGNPGSNPGGETSGAVTPMYRLYNPNSGEHFYTGSAAERDNLVSFGWQYEGVAWNAPTDSGEPVYRLYNPNSGDHHYTMSADERDFLVSVGWQYEGVCWNSAPADKLPLHRLYNPNADCGSHHYTGSTEERDFLVSLGWHYEGIGWFGMP